jgi:hypothetical protein
MENTDTRDEHLTRLAELLEPTGWAPPAPTPPVERTLADFTRTDLYPDPIKRWTLTKRAMRLWLAVTGIKDDWVRDRYTRWLEELPPVESNLDYFDRLDSIKEFAVDEWRFNNGDNCTEGTNQFLRTFGFDELEEPETTKYVTVSITLRLQVTNQADPDDTADDVRRYLTVNANTASVDDVDEYSISSEINDVLVDVD